MLALAALLLLVLVGGRLYALFRGPVPESPAGEAAAGESIFTGLGQIRATTAAPNPATVVLSIAFPYHADDRDFSGEISARSDDFRNSTSSYLGSLYAARLRQTGEDAVKAELLARFNSFLRLGQIEKLYFSDYMIIE